MLPLAPNGGLARLLTARTRAPPLLLAALECTILLLAHTALSAACSGLFVVSMQGISAIPRALMLRATLAGAMLLLGAGGAGVPVPALRERAGIKGRFFGATRSSPTARFVIVAVVAALIVERLTLPSAPTALAPLTGLLGVDLAAAAFCTELTRALLLVACHNRSTGTSVAVLLCAGCMWAAENARRPYDGAALAANGGMSLLLSYRSQLSRSPWDSIYVSSSYQVLAVASPSSLQLPMLFALLATVVVRDHRVLLGASTGARRSG